MKCFVCGRTMIPDCEAIIGYHGKIIHESCRVGAAARSVLTGVLWILVALFLTLLFAGKIHADVNDQSTWVKGSVVIGITNDGRCVFKPFIKVDDTTDDPDDGKPQIIGYSPGNVVITRDGKGVVWERVLEENFIPLNQHKTIHGRMCKCPPYQE